MLKILLRVLPILALLALSGYVLWDSYNIRSEKLTVSIKGLPKIGICFLFSHTIS